MNPEYETRPSGDGPELKGTPCSKPVYEWIVCLTERHDTGVEASTREEAIEIACRDGFGGSTHCLGYTAKKGKRVS